MSARGGDISNFISVKETPSRGWQFNICRSKGMSSCVFSSFVKVKCAELSSKFGGPIVKQVLIQKINVSPMTDFDVPGSSFTVNEMNIQWEVKSGASRR